MKCLSHSLCDVRWFVIERTPDDLTYYETYGIIYINKKVVQRLPFIHSENIKHIAEQFIPSWIVQTTMGFPKKIQVIQLHSH